MRSTIFSVAFALFIVTASALDVPECAMTCAKSAIEGTGCSLDDAKCLCANPKFLQAAATCVQAACSPADQLKASSFCSSGSTSVGSNTATPTKASGSATGSTSASTTVVPSGTVDIGMIPACAGTCVYSAVLGTSCANNDFACMCNDPTIPGKIVTCITGPCGPADQQKLVLLMGSLCSTSSSNSTHASTTHSSTGGHSGNTTATAISNSTRTSTSPTGSTTSSSTSTSSESDTTTAGPSSTTHTTAPASTSTGGAARIVGSGFLAAGMGMAFFIL